MLIVQIMTMYKRKVRKLELKVPSLKAITGAIKTSRHVPVNAVSFIFFEL